MILDASTAASSSTKARCPANGTASTTMSPCVAASRLLAPTTSPPLAAASSAPLARARSSSRDPMKIWCPARPSRSASPLPSLPVPPRIPIFMSQSPWRYRAVVFLLVGVLAVSCLPSVADGVERCGVFERREIARGLAECHRTDGAAQDFGAARLGQSRGEALAGGPKRRAEPVGHQRDELGA